MWRTPVEHSVMLKTFFQIAIFISDFFFFLTIFIHFKYQKEKQRTSREGSNKSPKINTMACTS